MSQTFMRRLTRARRSVILSILRRFAMHWKLKATLQNAVAALPSDFGYACYYLLQRKFGALRRPNPVSRIQAGIEIARRIQRQGQELAGLTFLEVGTGRRLNMPVALWLAGAERIVSVDLNPYLREELVRDDLSYVARYADEVRGMFAGLPFQEDRYAALLKVAREKCRLEDVLDLCRIEYTAPGDATALPLADGCIDAHVSYTVFEHIPQAVLEAILIEGNRVVRPGGLFIHRIDHSDHFSHSDKTISAVNFLQYDDRTWDRLAGNRYMYMNRLRVDDFEQLFARCRHQLLAVEGDVDPEIEELLDSAQLALDAQFRHKPRRVLATTGSWITSRRAA